MLCIGGNLYDSKDSRGHWGYREDHGDNAQIVSLAKLQGNVLRQEVDFVRDSRRVSPQPGVVEQPG